MCDINNNPQPEQTFQLYVDGECRTRSKIIEYDFKWTLDNFLSLMQFKPNQSTISTTFSLEPKHKSEWSLQVNQTMRRKDFLTDIILRSVNLTQQINGFVEICLLSANGTKHKIIRSDLLTGKDNNINVNYTESCPRNQEVIDYLPDGKLIIFVRFEILESFHTQSIEQIQIPEANLSCLLRRVLVSKKHSDVTFVVGDKEFPVHKNILAARSDVFAAMFEHDLEEQKSNRVLINDIEADVVQKMIDFIYTGEDPIMKDEDGEKVKSLLFVADKYALNELKVMCEQTMFRKLCFENAADTLVLADRHSFSILKMKTIEFINCNNKEVLSTKGWENMRVNFPSLVIEVYEALSPNPNTTL